MKRAAQKGMTLIELVVSFTIMLTLSVMAIPLARVKIRTQREFELRYALREMREAIDKYKDACDMGTFGAIKQGTFCYPETLTALVDGVKTQSADGKKMKFLRSIPRDPFTNSTEWGFRSMQQEITAETWSGDNIFNVYSKTSERDADGKPYSEW
jgi:general secretion pathway protein G